MKTMGIGSWFGRVSGTSWRGSRRRGRRAAVGVEAMEGRVSQSGFAVQTPGVIVGIEDPNERAATLVVQTRGVISGIEDPNLRAASLARTFNPQPDPPTAVGIIAI